MIQTQRRLVMLDENVKNAMSQIGAQLSSRLDALTALVEVTRDYARPEGEALLEAVNAKRSLITAKSTPDDVRRQEEIISETLGRITKLTEQYPGLKDDQTYIKTMVAVQT